VRTTVRGCEVLSAKWTALGGRLGVAVAGAALVLGGCAAALEHVPMDSLARLGRAALPIGPEKEQEIGFGIAATVAGRYPLVQDTALQGYVNRVGQTVAMHSVRGGEVAFRFAVLDTDDVNAFAAPGGYVFITRGSLALMSSEAELAGVLAHEVGHVDQSHVLDEIRRSSMVQTARDESQLSGAMLDHISGFAGSLLFTGLSRADEMEADSVGLMYAAASGYRADGLVRFLHSLHAAETGAPQSRLRELRATHPATADRLEALQRQMGGLGVDPAGGSAGELRFRRYVRGR
jgi:beta-barrel assembly-enhancing protease